MEVVLKKLHVLIVLGFVVSLFAVSRFVLAENRETKELKRAVFKVENLSCGGCFTTINQSLAPKKGFSGFGVNLFRKLVAVDFLPPLTAEAIAKTITDQGYSATVESVQDITKKESFAVVHAKSNLYSGCSGGGQSSCSGTPLGVSANAAQNQPTNNSSSASCCAVSSINQ